ncbi:DNA excision repair protein ERCC-6 [Plectosphaerella cucumerina]|uniref:DNA excision repair protein ERCC-6 n=1 Tax=Plectosphaerella cucumerina TaxID=40658 RepID=A0A8K0TEB0_9PEZI|nr:DNA excision repair protein ERCC-6 [Plectosphaerella cucumerina]
MAPTETMEDLDGFSDRTVSTPDPDLDLDIKPDPEMAPLSPLRPFQKRKFEPITGEKYVWDLDSDDGKDLQARLKKKNKRPRKSTGKGKGKGKEKDVKREPLDPPQHDYEVACAPEYLVERRLKFEENRRVLVEGGLMLPPQYHDFVYELPRSRPILERPQFPESACVKPCREYKDIELQYSAGVIPAPIAQYLRDYQVEGVQFLHRLFVYQKGGILGDDMGLGKTVQVAAFLTAAFGKTGDERDDKRMRWMRIYGCRWYPRILIVCPGTLIENWRNELARWGFWHVQVFHGADKQDMLATARAGRAEILITTYGTYKNHESAVNMVEWDAVVADECHTIKSSTAEITKAMDKVNALCRIGLTGTAIQNNYSELWTLLNWTNPGHFGTASEWEYTIAKPLKVGQSHDATLLQLKTARVTARKLVENLLPDFFLRRMKSIIAHQLPKKSDRVVFCPLTDLQRDAYKRFTETPEVELLRTLTDPCDCGSDKKKGWCCNKKLPNGHSWMSIVFPSVIVLQKLANHLTMLVPTEDEDPQKHKRELHRLQDCCPDNWDFLYKNRRAMDVLANPEFCGKWKVLRKLLKFWHENGDKVLVFSHSVRLLRILQTLFLKTSYHVTYLDGSMSYPDRQKAVDNFNSSPSEFVFLISTRAGGVGLNITAANKVVIFDPHWNPAHDLQAQDRAYRMGQTRDVDVFRLVSSGTIEEIVYARQIYKQQQANIGYTASSERRYFKGVQEDEGRKGEIFGLENLFTFREDQLVIRDIVNKTNIAEAKAGTGIALVGLDMEQVADDEELRFLKTEEGGLSDDGGMAQLAKLVTRNADDGHGKGKAKAGEPSDAPRQPKSDVVQAILASAGVEYSHENSEVIGTSKVEQKLSRAAEAADAPGETSLFDDDITAEHTAACAQGAPRRLVYNPPGEVMRRQFCSMAREFGFADATSFALVVESWTQEQRRSCLERFYKIREGKLLAAETVEAEMERQAKMEVKEVKGEVKAEVKGEVKVEVKGEVKAEVKVSATPPVKGTIYIDDTESDDEL